MRKLDPFKLREYLAIQGKLSKETLAVECGISVSKIERLLRGKRDATKPEMHSLCMATGIGMNDLFPVFADEKEAG
jgi:transcriptional regulator with XRE-family HTH domain